MIGSVVPLLLSQLPLLLPHIPLLLPHVPQLLSLPLLLYASGVYFSGPALAKNSVAAS
jgi:hypothetical protein